MELAKKSRARGQAKRAAKAKRVGGKKYVTVMPVAKRKSPAQAKEFGARIPVGSKSSATKTRKPHGRVISKDITPGKSTTKRKPTRTPAQRAAAKEKLLAEQKTLRKKSAGMRYGSEFKIPELGKKEQDAMARAMESGSGGGLIKAGVGAALTAAALKMHKMHKVKKAKDLASGKTGGTSAGIGSTRAASAASRTSGLGKKTPKKKKPKRKSGPSKFLSNILKKAADYGKPKSAFSKLKKTQRRMPK